MSVINTARTLEVPRVAPTGNRPAPYFIRAAAEAAVVCAAAAVAVMALHATMTHELHPLQGRAEPLLASATAGLAAVVALLCAASSRIGSEPGLRMFTYVWAYYAIIVMPVSVVNESPGASPFIPGVASAAGAALIALLALSLVTTFPRRGEERRMVNMTIASIMLVVASALSAFFAANVDMRVTRAALLLLWCVLICAFIVHGFQQRVPVWYRMGYGIALIAASHAVLLRTGQSTEFAVVRLVGFLVLVVALCLYTRTVIAQRRAERAQADAAAEAIRRSAIEDRHEMRNVLATLAGVTTLLEPRPGVGGELGDGSIGEMIDEELARLRSLLDGTANTGETGSATLDAVLVRLVTLRRCSGATITLDCPPGLVAGVPATTLTQVVTNLLENCARHAPGAEVHVCAYRDHDVCVVEVTDAGPGLDAAAPTAGEGVGLALSKQLIESVGGTLYLRAGTRFPSGTTAILHVPTADGSPRESAVLPNRERAVL